MAQYFTHSVHIGSLLKCVCSKGVAQAVKGQFLGQSGTIHSLSEHILNAARLVLPKTSFFLQYRTIFKALVSVPLRMLISLHFKLVLEILTIKNAFLLNHGNEKRYRTYFESDSEESKYHLGLSH